MFCRKSMLPLGSQQAPLYVSRQKPAKGYPHRACDSIPPNVNGFARCCVALNERPIHYFFWAISPLQQVGFQLPCCHFTQESEDRTSVRFGPAVRVGGRQRQLWDYSWFDVGPRKRQINFRSPHFERKGWKDRENVHERRRERGRAGGSGGASGARKGEKGRRWS